MKSYEMPHGHRSLDDLDERPLPQRALFALMRTMHAHRQLMNRKMGEHGVHPSQAFCLREVAHNDGITQRDLAERLNISRPTLTVMLQKMERTRLIERRADSTDQRYTRIYLTPTGTEAHEAMHSVLAEVVEDTTGPLSAEDQAELIRILRIVHDNTVAALAAGGSDDAPLLDEVL